MESTFRFIQRSLVTTCDEDQTVSLVDVLMFGIAPIILFTLFFIGVVIIVTRLVTKCINAWVSYSKLLVVLKNKTKQNQTNKTNKKNFNWISIKVCCIESKARNLLEVLSRGVLCTLFSWSSWFVGKCLTCPDTLRPVKKNRSCGKFLSVDLYSLIGYS